MQQLGCSPLRSLDSRRIPPSLSSDNRRKRRRSALITFSKQRIHWVSESEEYVLDRLTLPKMSCATAALLHFCWWLVAPPPARKKLLMFAFGSRSQLSMNNRRLKAGAGTSTSPATSHWSCASVQPSRLRSPYVHLPSHTWPCIRSILLLLLSNYINPAWAGQGEARRS
jgi:hypothetical protein